MKRMFKSLFYLTLLNIILFKSNYSNAQCVIWLSTTNQNAKPTSCNSNVSNDSNLNQILNSNGVRKFQQAFKNSVRPEAINELVIYANCNGDSLKQKIDQTHLFDTVINLSKGELKLACTSPVVVNDPLIHTWNNWAMDMIEANCAWSISKGDDRVVIGFSDTEFDDGHEDLIGKFTKVWHSIPGSSPAEYHGTKVASVAIANTNNNIGITSIGYNTKGAGYAIDDATDPREGILQAYYDGIRIINVSWYPDGITKAEAEEMTQHGTVLLYAAGNDPAFVSHPAIANVPGVIVTSGVNSDNLHGPTNTSRNAYVDLCAPSEPVLRAHSRLTLKDILFIVILQEVQHLQLRLL